MQHAQENLEAIASTLESGRGVYFIHSYPRSGNTWMRHLVSDVLLQNSGIETQTKLAVHPDQIIPDLYTNRISEIDHSISTHALLVKTHEPFTKVKEFYKPEHLNLVKHVYIFRAPEDALISYYHFHLRYDELKDKAADGPDAFCIAHLSDWSDHVRSYIEAKATGLPIKILTYESMLSDTASNLSDVCNWFKITHTNEIIKTAVDHMEFKNLRANEEKTSQNKTEFFYRKGQKGSGKDELQPATIMNIQTATYDLVRSL